MHGHPLLQPFIEIIFEAHHSPHCGSEGQQGTACTTPLELRTGSERRRIPLRALVLNVQQRPLLRGHQLQTSHASLLHR
jgi:hypothetical protein